MVEPCSSLQHPLGLIIEVLEWCCGKHARWHTLPNHSTMSEDFLG